MRIVAVLLCALASMLAPAQYQPGWSRAGEGPLAVTASQQIRFSGLTAIEAIDRNGNTLWSKPHVYDLYRKLVTVGEDTIHTSAPSGGQPAQVLCLDESGDERWSRIFPGVVAKMIPIGDHVYIICDQAALGRDLVVVTKLNRISGAEVWSEATGGFSLNLSSTSPHALVPSTVTVPEGQSSVTFTFPTTSPATTTLAEITAHVLAGSKKAYLRINP